MDCVAECVDAAPSRRTIAYAATDPCRPGCAASGFVSCVPRLQGARIVIAMQGCLRLQLGHEHAGFGCTVPSVNVHLLPALRTEFVGTWHLWCTATGLVVEINHASCTVVSRLTGNGSNSVIQGRVLYYADKDSMPVHAWTAQHAANQAHIARQSAAEFNTGAAQLLGTLDGSLDGAVYFRAASPSPPHYISSQTSITVWNAKDILQAETAAGLPHAIVDDTAAEDKLPAQQVWGHTASALRRCRWDDARGSKNSVERLARAAAQRGASCGWVGACGSDARDGGGNSTNFAYSRRHGWQPKKHCQ